jgi:hypothetical protein
MKFFLFFPLLVVAFSCSKPDDRPAPTPSLDSLTLQYDFASGTAKVLNYPNYHRVLSNAVTTTCFDPDKNRLVLFIHDSLAVVPGSIVATPQVAKAESTEVVKSGKSAPSSVIRVFFSAEMAKYPQKVEIKCPLKQPFFVQ